MKFEVGQEVWLVAPMFSFTPLRAVIRSRTDKYVKSGNYWVTVENASDSLNESLKETTFLDSSIFDRDDPEGVAKKLEQEIESLQYKLERFRGKM